MSKTFRTMSDTELKSEARRIVSTSSSEDEVRQRLATELAYPYGIAITSQVPTDEAGFGARGLVCALGGLVLRNGAMVMVMMHGHDGIINL